MPAQRLPILPPPLEGKIYKTGQTRGANDVSLHRASAALGLEPSAILFAVDGRLPQTGKGGR